MRRFGGEEVVKHGQPLQLGTLTMPELGGNLGVMRQERLNIYSDSWTVDYMHKGLLMVYLGAERSQGASADTNGAVYL